MCKCKYLFFMLSLSLIVASLAASIDEIVLVIFLVSVGIGTIFSSKNIGVFYEYHITCNNAYEV